MRTADITCRSTKQNTQDFFSLPAASFYPGYHGRTSLFDTESGPPPLQNDNLDGEDEEWTDEEDLADLAQRQPGKFNESIANEVRHWYLSNSANLQLLSQRPTWQHSATTTGSNVPVGGSHPTSSTETLTSHNDTPLSVPDLGALTQASGKLRPHLSSLLT